MPDDLHFRNLMNPMTRQTSPSEGAGAGNHVFSAAFSARRFQRAVFSATREHVIRYGIADTKVPAGQSGHAGALGWALH
jgi:hypothetical protein